MNQDFEYTAKRILIMLQNGLDPHTELINDFSDTFIFVFRVSGLRMELSVNCICAPTYDFSIYIPYRDSNVKRSATIDTLEDLCDEIRNLILFAKLMR